ncbi:MAG: GNAT family N-acetyltransferase [Bacteroidota bacterium]|nr:GNAT family N-acetyltransferase [Bacteroidota bacterium]
MNGIEIQRAALADIEQLRHIGRQTFLEAFSGENTADNMQKYVADNFNINKLTDEIRNTNSEFYFATLDTNAVGYLKINVGQAQSELKDDNALEIERIYVLQEFWRKGVGQILIDKALQIAAQRQADYAWLGVWEKNSRAISFYKKNGFTEFGRHIFKLGEDVQTDIMMKLNIGRYKQA